MAKKKKFKGNNAQLVGDTRLTKREMKKFQAVYHNVSRDNEKRMEQHAIVQAQAGTVNIGGVANLGDVNA
ncbi:hypothetical protein ST201phi2-1p063 [Pseudomonas phage 201phi2-1]|uniref:Uncharacterized protein n=1 Tax=Pseudomonas phage 201phi2-1 TaxID=198110 RepID=B3FK38_BP201|nr:hypothetical protein ST201phi2-1p063 [Pseudomonas phage 201phi2-1]ABY62896.1 hypothetical protein 201phi2-1p063 [Pseudomonas phage 201phi2-1]